MKAGKFIVALILIMSLMFSACGKDGMTKEIEELNENSNLDFRLAVSESELNPPEDFELWKYEDFGAYSLHSSDGLTKYWVSGYPDVLNGLKLTSFSTTDPKYSIFGIHVGGDPDNAIETLKEYSYQLMKKESDENMMKFKKGKVYIRIYIEDGRIWSLDAYLNATNKKNVVF